MDGTFALCELRAPLAATISSEGPLPFSVRRVANPFPQAPTRRGVDGVLQWQRGGGRASRKLIPEVDWKLGVITTNSQENRSAVDVVTAHHHVNAGGALLAVTNGPLVRLRALRKELKYRAASFP